VIDNLVAWAAVSVEKRVVSCRFAVFAYESPEANNAPESVSRENVVSVANILRQLYPRPGQLKEELIFQIYFYVPENVVCDKYRAELVAKLAMSLQKRLSMEGMPVPTFPDSVDQAYLDRALEFLQSEERKHWSGWQPARADPRIRLLTAYSEENASTSPRSHATGHRLESCPANSGGKKPSLFVVASQPHL